MKNLLTKIQGLSELKRKIIFVVLVIIIASVSLVFEIKNTQRRFKNFRIEKLKEELQLPKIEVPKIPGEMLKIPK